MFPCFFGLSERAPERRLRLKSVATRRASLPCTIDVSRPRTRNTITALEYSTSSAISQIGLPASRYAINFLSSISESLRPRGFFVIEHVG